jgi:hypothetical protein
MTRWRVFAMLLLGSLLFPACSHEGEDARGPVSSKPSAPQPGKLETIETQRYPAPEREETKQAQGPSAPEGSQEDVIRVEGQSAGTAGLVLTRAMSGAQALGYTLLSVDDRGYFFVAEKRASLLGAVLGGNVGVCRVAVGTTPDPDTGAVKVSLKGRAQTTGGRTVCERDLQKMLEYARGEVIVKPKKPSGFPRPGGAYQNEP